MEKWMLLTMMATVLKTTNTDLCEYCKKENAIGGSQLTCSNVTSLFFQNFDIALNKTHFLICKNCSLSTIDEDTFNVTSNYINFLILLNSDIRKLKNHAFRKFSNLRVLNLRDNSIDTIEPHTFKSITKLLQLDLGKNSIKYLTNYLFSELVNLDMLTVNYNNIFIIQPEAFLGLMNLKHLNLNNNCLQRLDENNFKYLINLKILYIENNNITTIHPLAFSNLTNLNHLYLNNNSIKYLVQYNFKPLVNLVDLQLRTNDLMQVQTSSFNGLKNIRNLYLGENKLETVKPYGFIGLESLQILELIKNKFKIFNYEYYKDLLNLTMLWLDENEINNFTIDYKADKLQNLRVLNLNGNNLTSLNYKLLYHKMPNLEEIFIANNTWKCEFLVNLFNFFQNTTVNLCSSNNCSVNTTIDYIEDICSMVAVTADGDITTDFTTENSASIHNEFLDVQLYGLLSEELSNIFQFFTCKLSNRPIKPNQIMKCNFIYRPTIPNRQDIAEFRISDGDGNLHVVKTTGQSIGPILETSVNGIVFYVFKRKKRTSTVIQLKNVSDIEITFKFDFDQHPNDIFHVEPTNGTIKPKSRLFVTIKFFPQKMNKYVFDLWILVMYHEATKIQLFGINEPKNEYYLENVQYINMPIPADEKFGNREYLRFSEMLNDSKTPLKFKKNSLLFDKNNRSQPLAVTNNLDQILSLTWDKDLNNIFNIIPSQVNIPARETVLFECAAVSVPSNINTKCMTGRVEWISPRSMEFLNSIVIPMPMQIRLIAIGRDRNDYWFRHVEVCPNPVVLPPCLKNCKTYTTFMLRNTRLLTSMYELIPPKKSQIVIKPLRKEIKQYQLHVVQFCPKEIGIFTEEWKVIVDLQEYPPVFIEFKAQCDEPFIEIGDNNVVEFKNIQPKFSECMMVLIKNPSIFRIKYTFIIPDEVDYLSVSPSEGIINSNEEYYITIYAVGKLCVNETEIICRFSVCEHNMLFCHENELLNEITVTIKTPIIYSELTAIPSYLNKGDLLWNTNIKTSFCLFNFGLSYVPFTLTCINCENMVKITPETGYVYPQEQTEIEVEVTIKNYGKCSFSIFYGSVDPTAEKIPLFTLECNCVCHTFQVKEIVSYSFGKLFGKLTLWNSMNIDRLNEILATIKHDETAEITMYMPECEQSHDENHLVEFTVENISAFDIPINLKRIQLCNCEPIKVNTGYSSSKTQYFCPHKNMLTILMTDKLSPGFREALTFKVQYTEPNETMLRYKLDIGDKRIIIISIIIKSLPSEISTLSVYCHDYTLDMGKVFIGQLNPPLQLYWLYNNSNNSVTYNLDDLEITKLCNLDGFEVLKCLNPIDILPPYNSMPILFRFVPIEAKMYKISVPVLLGDKVIKLSLLGEGVMESNLHIPKTQHLMPPMSTSSKNSINVTYDHLIFEPMPIWSNAEKLIFLQNPTDRIYEYIWEPTEIDGILKIEATNAVGIIHPNESLHVLIKVSTLNEPCTTTLLLACRLIDYTQKMLHEASLELYNKNEKRVTEEFTIRDNEEVHEVNTVKILPQGKQFYKTVSLSIDSVSLTDLDVNIKVSEQFKFTPSKNVQINKSKVLRSYMQDMGVFLKSEDEFSQQQEEDLKVDLDREKILFSSLEKLIAAVVHSEAFKNIIHDLHIKPSPFYSQIKRSEKLMSAEDSRSIGEHNQMQKEAEVFLHKPPAHELCSTFRTLIADTINRTFKLNVHVDESFLQSEFLKEHLKNIQEKCNCEHSHK